jgi:hypothetical protein
MCRLRVALTTGMKGMIKQSLLFVSRALLASKLTSRSRPNLLLSYRFAEKSVVGKSGIYRFNFA